MKRTPLVAATLTLLVTSFVGAAQQDEVSMPEVSVTGARPQAPHHPQDPLYSERPLGCVEIVTPSSGGNGGFSYYAASKARSGKAVIPSLNDPTSANETYRRGARPDESYYQDPKTPPGLHIPNPCD
jgi:hypothetical protein